MKPAAVRRRLLSERVEEATKREAIFVARAGKPVARSYLIGCVGRPLGCWWSARVGVSAFEAPQEVGRTHLGYEPSVGGQRMEAAC